MNYNISELNFKDYIIGSGWPSYQKISIKEMADTLPDMANDTVPEPQNTPRYDAAPEPQNTPRYDAAPEPQNMPRNDTAPEPQNMPRYDAAPEPQNTPRYDTMPGNSRITQPDARDVNPREVRLVKELYTRLNKTLLPYVVRVIDEYEYVDSPIYDENGIDRETIAQLISRVIEMAGEEMDQAQEIELEALQVPTWSRSELLNGLVQSLILNEIFMVRRPRYRRARGNYRYSGGIYDGINPQ